MQRTRALLLVKGSGSMAQVPRFKIVDYGRATRSMRLRNISPSLVTLSGRGHLADENRAVSTTTIHRS